MILMQLKAKVIHLGTEQGGAYLLVNASRLGVTILGTLLTEIKVSPLSSCMSPDIGDSQARTMRTCILDLGASFYVPCL